MADSLVNRLLVEQRKRMVASILGGAENSPWWSRLRPEEQQAYRVKVRDATGVFYDFCRDVIKCGEEDAAINEHVVRVIESVHASQRRLEGKLNGG